jgi:hypothetical protein
MEFWPEWNLFFQNLPLNNDVAHDSYFDVITELSKTYGNAIHTPSIYARGIYILFFAK